MIHVLTHNDLDGEEYFGGLKIFYANTNFNCQRKKVDKFPKTLSI
jgi:hypothetical protein